CEAVLQFRPAAPALARTRVAASLRALLQHCARLRTARVARPVAGSRFAVAQFRQSPTPFEFAKRRPAPASRTQGSGGAEAAWWPNDGALRAWRRERHAARWFRRQRRGGCVERRDGPARLPAAFRIECALPQSWPARLAAMRLSFPAPAVLPQGVGARVRRSQCARAPATSLRPIAAANARRSSPASRLRASHLPGGRAGKCTP